jgi:Protein of unknown function (DUF2854)
MVVEIYYIIMLRKISLASLGLTVGGIMTVSGIIAYIVENATINVIGFSYGIPILLGGIAFKITELKPIPETQPPSAEAIALRATQATEIQKQIFKDVTRYWYGQDAHFDFALKKIGFGRSKEQQPVLTGLYETVVDGSYTLVLELYSPFKTLEEWHAKKAKIESFLGPGIQAEITQPKEQEIHLALVAKPAAEIQAAAA